MDTQTLIQEAKARFNHNLAKATLKEKYENKLILADQGGLWKADTSTITFLSSFKEKNLVLLDTFGNAVQVDRKDLLDKLKEVYFTVMNEWYQETKELEGKR